MPKTEITLTPREEQALAFIVAFIKANQYPPSVRELQTELGLASTQPAHLLLTRLRDKGVIEWQPSQPRTIRMVLPDPN